MSVMSSPLTAELSDEAKAVLAAQFAQLKERLAACPHILNWGALPEKPWRSNRRNFWER